MEKLWHHIIILILPPTRTFILRSSLELKLFHRYLVLKRFWGHLFISSLCFQQSSWRESRQPATRWTLCPGNIHQIIQTFPFNENAPYIRNRILKYNVSITIKCYIKPMLMLMVIVNKWATYQLLMGTLRASLGIALSLKVSQHNYFSSFLSNTIFTMKVSGRPIFKYFICPDC